jgi:hypothetical protein
MSAIKSDSANSAAVEAALRNLTQSKASLEATVDEELATFLNSRTDGPPRSLDDILSQSSPAEHKRIEALRRDLVARYGRRIDLRISVLQDILNKTQAA